MKFTQNTFDLIKHYESLHDGNLKAIGLQPKMCPAGLWTVGYGHALSDPDTGKFLKGDADAKRALELCPAMTIDEAENMLLQDMDRFAAIVKAALTITVQEERFGALVSFCYNVGQGNFMSSTLLKLTNNYQFEEAGNEFLKWDKATVNGVKKRLAGLTCRRQSERLLFLTGELKFFAK